MDKKELYRKWKFAIDTHLKSIKNPVAEVETKKFLSNEISNIESDIELCNSNSEEKIKIVPFIKNLISHSTKVKLYSHTNIAPIRPSNRPSLDDYDSRRDRHNNGDIVKYRGSFGIYREQ